MRPLAKCLLGIALALAPGRVSGSDLRSSRSDAGRPDPAVPVATDLLSRIPLTFEENRGQAEPGTAFLARGRGWTAAVRGDGARFDLQGALGSSVTMRLRGARAEAPVTGLDPVPSRTNYFLGNDPSRWVTDVPHFRGLRAAEPLPGVSLRWMAMPLGRVRYDLELAAGADPSSLGLDFEGASALSVEKDGSVLVECPAGMMRHSAPVAWQVAAGGRRAVPCSFVVADRSARFVLGPYDAALPLVIDPTVLVSTYFGTGNVTYAYGSAIDSAGNVYLSGPSSSSNNGTSGAYQQLLKANQDVFVAKFPHGSSSFTYFTYLGGDSDDRSFALALDSSGAAYVTGTTWSNNFPTSNAAQNAPGTNPDSFVAKIGPTGGTLGFSTYFGGNNTEYGYGIAVDRDGYSWVAGYTESTNLTLVNPLYSTHQGVDGFIARFPPTGGAISFSSLLGGSSGDVMTGIAVSGDTTIWVSGYSASSDFPTKSAVQGSLAGNADGVLARLSADGSTLLYSSYLGGSGNDNALGVSVDHDGDVWVTGFTTSSDFPTASALQGTNGGGYDAFLYKFDVANLATAVSTYFGGSSVDFGYAISVDPNDDIVFTGYTTSTNLPLASALYATRSGGDDGFLAKVTGDGSTLLFSTYFGGTADEYGHSVAADGGVAVVGGSTKSTDFPQVNGRGQSWSGQLVGTLVEVEFLPAPLRSLAVTLATGQEVDIAWTDPHSGTYGIEVQRRSGTGSFSTIATPSAGSTSYADTTVVENGDYEYRVRGTSAGGDTGWSNRARTMTPIRAAGSLSVTDAANDSIALGWQDLSQVETGYQVLRRVGTSGSFTATASLPAGSQSWTDSSVLPEVTYQYLVRTVASGGATADSSTVSRTTPPANPTLLDVQSTSDVEMRLSWTDNSSSETGFEVQRRDDDAGGVFSAVTTVSSGIRNFADSGLLPESAYSWRVRAVNANGASYWTSVVSATTPPAAPTGLVVGLESFAEVGLSWTDNSSAETGFVIERQGPGDAAFVELMTEAADSVSAVDDTALQEATNYYRVRARNSNGTSRPTAVGSVTTPAQLVIAKAVLKLASGTKPSRLTASGTFDVGPGSLNLPGAATLEVGEVPIAIPGFTELNGGSLLRHEAEGLRFDLKRAAGGASAVAFTLVLEGGAAGDLDPDGILSLSFQSGAFTCGGSARLTGGKLVAGKGAWPWTSVSILVTSFKADVGPAGDQGFALSATFRPYEGTPAVAPDLRLSLNNRPPISLPGTLFTAKKGKFTYKTKEGVGWSITLDPLRGTLSLKASHADLGAIDVGPVALKIDLTIGTLRYLDTPVLLSNGKTVSD